MPYSLYNRRGSGGFAAEAALTLAGQPFELITLDSVPNSPLPEAFRAVNPWRQVPVLLCEDGSRITETAAILAYIASTHPGPNVGPAVGTPAFGQLLRWSVFLGVNVYEGVLRGIYSSRYTTETTATAVAGVRQAAIARNREAFSLVEAELADGRAYLLGETISVVDPYCAMLFGWQRSVDGLPHCVAFTHRVARHPRIAPLWQHNFDHRLAVKWGRDSCS